MLVFFTISAVVLTLFGVNSLFLVPAEIEKFKSLVDEEKFDEAMQVYKHGLEGHSRNPRVAYGLALIYEYRQEWFLAVSQYRRLLAGGKFPPETSEVSIRLRRVEVNKNIQQYDEVVEDCYAILQINPEHPIANFEVGKRLYSLKNYRAAKPFLEKINQNDNKEILEILLDIEIHEKNFEKAVDHLNQLNGILQGVLPPEIMFKQILIHFNLKKFLAVIQDSQSLPTQSDAKIPVAVGIIIGVSYAYCHDKQQAMKYFKEHLKGYIDDSSDYILEARYLYTELLFEQNNFYQALTQNNYIEQMTPDYRDVMTRKRVLSLINNTHNVKKLLSINDMEEMVDEMVKFFKLPDFFFIEKQIVYQQSEKSDKKWFILSASNHMNKVFQIFVSFNISLYNDQDINEIFSQVRNIDNNIQKFEFIFLTLFGMGIDAEKTFIESFNSCFFYSQEDFINCIKNRRLPILSS